MSLTLYPISNYETEKILAVEEPQEKKILIRISRKAKHMLIRTKKIRMQAAQDRITLFSKKKTILWR